MMSGVLEDRCSPSSAIADIARPNLPLAAVRAVAEKTYGVVGEIGFLPSERDQIAVLSISGQATFTLRISGASEPREILELQNRALIKIASDDPSLPVPRVCRSVRRRSIEEYAEGGRHYHVRLLTFVPGEPLRDQPRSGGLYADVGRCLARVDKALLGITMPPSARTLVWDVRHALNLVPLLRHVHDEEPRKRVEIVFDALANRALPRLARLPAQVIHNDFNPKNVLVDPASPSCVSGVIDFGDMTEAPSVVDLGVAIARHIDLPDPLLAASTIAAGYNSVRPLRDEEIDLLYDIACARLAMRTVIWSWRLDANDARCDPAQIVNAVELLRVLQARGADAMGVTFHDACRKGHSNGAA